MWQKYHTAGNLGVGNKRIFDLWLACHTQREIAEREDLTQQAVDQILQEMASLPKLVKSAQAAADHATDFKPPIHNIWKQPKKSSATNYFGNSEIRWVDNLLYLYAQVHR